MNRETPKGWVWAYHVTLEQFLSSISEEGLKPTRHEALESAPVIFVEPNVAGVEPYWARGMALLRFRTPGFDSTDDGEDVIVGGDGVGAPPEPLVGEPGEAGVVPPERLQVLVDKKFKWLIP